MADIASVLESNTAPEQEVDICGKAQEDTASQLPLVMTEGDDSVFYSEEEEIPQQILDSIWAPHSGEPIWPEKLNSAHQIHTSGAQSSCHSIGLMEASSEHDSVAMLKEMEGTSENKVNNASSTDTDVHGETAANSRIKHTEELSTPPAVPLRMSTPAEAAQMKERADTYTDESSSFLPDEAGETELPGDSSVNLEEVEEEHGLDIACESNNKPFNHLMHAKYGTVSYRRIRRGQTRKRIEMFESMMQL
ncbi:hypothetical protein PGIGA_G00218890 [Pangasianodon gigas]|uniref:Uncharacterized protein n=1 Tax=Pangasianodon gigas TaxID=30993 RepID=A0ACC5WIK2_PANGG|nr:hypothetical protein [Pangasianodon gigas]